MERKTSGKKKSKGATKKDLKQLAMSSNGGQHDLNGQNGNPQSQPENEVLLQETLTQLTTTLASLQAEIAELKTFQGTLDCFTSEWKTQVDQGLSGAQCACDHHDFRIKLLTNTVI